MEEQLIEKISDAVLDVMNDYSLSNKTINVTITIDDNGWVKVDKLNIQ